MRYTYIRRWAIASVLIVIWGAGPAAASPVRQHATSVPNGPLHSAALAIASSLLHQDRATAHMPDLQINPQLTAIAMSYSVHMLARYQRTHRWADSAGIYALMRQRHIGYLASSENTASSTMSASQSLAGALGGINNALLTNPASRANILNKQYTEVGLGFAATPAGAFIVLEVFLQPTSPPGVGCTATVSTFNITQAETQLATVINQARAAHNLPSLRLDAELSALATWRSTDMLQDGFFSHDIPVGQSIHTVFYYMRRMGISYTSAGENIARNNYPGLYCPSTAIDMTHQSLMASPDHRANLLSPSYGRLGLGVALDANGMSILTEIFTN